MGLLEVLGYTFSVIALSHMHRFLDWIKKRVHGEVWLKILFIVEQERAAIRSGLPVSLRLEARLYQDCYRR